MLQSFHVLISFTGAAEPVYQGLHVLVTVLLTVDNPPPLQSLPSWLALMLIVALSWSRWVVGAFAVIIKHHWFNEHSI